MLSVYVGWFIFLNTYQSFIEKQNDECQKYNKKEQSEYNIKE